MNSDMELQASVVRQFNRFYTVRLGLLRSRYLDSDFSLSEGRILFELSLTPGSTANELRNKLGLDAGYMSRLLRSLGERGLVAGSRSPQDKRSTQLSLTEVGQAALADLDRRSSADIVRMLERLGGARRDELLAALATVQSILSEQGGAMPPVLPIVPVAPASTIVRATVAHVADAKRLLHEYFDVIGVLLRDDDAAILAFLSDPASALWIAYVDGEAAACVALRPLPTIAGAAECKRLYVGAQFRRRGLAESLMGALESFALEAGYQAIYLDSKDDLRAAIALYERLAYDHCARYNDNAQATVFMCKRLLQP